MSDAHATSEQLIREHVIWSCGAGLVPVPVVDFIAVTAIQLDLIRQLCTLHGISYEEGTGKVWIGGLSMSIASGASTYAVGKVINRHFENGGTMSNFNVDEAKSRYEGEYEEG